MNKEFSKRLEERTKAFAIRITVRQTDQEAKLILKTKLKSAKAKPAKQVTGWKLALL